MLTQEQKLQIIQDNATHEGDTGSPEVGCDKAMKRKN